RSTAKASLSSARASDRHDRAHIARRDGVHIGKNQVLRQIAPELCLVLALHDRKSVENVGRVLFPDAVEMKIDGVEPCPAMPTVILVPFEWRTIVPHIARERCNVIRGIGKVQDFPKNDVPGLYSLEPAHVRDFWKDGQLFNDEKVKMLSVDLLAREIVVCKRVQVGDQKGRVRQIRTHLLLDLFSK